MKILTFIKRIIFPPRCVFCDAILEPNTAAEICSDCVGKQKVCSAYPCCIKCGKPLASFGQKQLCYHCLNTRGEKFNAIASVFEYEGIVRSSIVRYKSAKIYKYANVYATFMAARFFEEFSDIDFDFMCAAPSHEAKNWRDELNMVEAICKPLSKLINVDFVPDVLVKTRKTQKQSSLGYKDRQKNLIDSMAAQKSELCPGKTVLLIDDVCTTRATISECASALKAAGAKKVYALTLATTVKNSPSDNIVL